jgi:hypothetical protein
LTQRCAVTDIKEESRGGISNQKMYSFWIVWPPEKNEKPKSADDASGAALDSDNEAERPKDLKQIVERKRSDFKEQHKRAEEEIERHQQNDNNFTMGVKVAAVAVGGVVVGALTAGMGLVPYITVVGVTATAAGGALALQYRKPSDSRLMLSCDTFEEATSWKLAIKDQIEQLEKQTEPMLPPSANPEIIAGIVGMNVSTGDWRKVGHLECMRVLELFSDSSPQTRTRKSQTVISCTPTNVFLSLMEVTNCFWPRDGGIKINQVIDDHADVLYVNVNFGRNNKNSRSCFLSRFWKLDDDGTFFIIYNSIPNIKDASTGNDTKITDNLQIDAVITVSPRKDHNEFDDDLREALVSASIQVASESKKLNTKEIEDFMDEFLYQLIELRVGLTCQKFICNKSKSSGLSNFFRSTPALNARPNIAKSSNAGYASGAVSTTTSAQLLQSLPTSKVAHMSKLFRMKSVDSVEVHDEGNPNIFQLPHSGKANLSPPRINNVALADNRAQPFGSEHQVRFRSSRRRGSQINAEASGLRKQIAAKEYELKRCEQVEKRKQDKAIIVDSHTEKRPYSTIISLDAQEKEIQQLKDSYYELTGIRYGDSSLDKRRRVRPAQSLNCKSPDIYNDSDLAANQDALTRARNFSISEIPAPYLNHNLVSDLKISIPSHWNVHAKNSKSSKSDVPKDEFWSKLFIVIAFGLCFSLSLTIGQAMKL